MRAITLSICFLPFLYYAIKDGKFHFQGRTVSLSEHILHAVIAIDLIILFSHSLSGNSNIVLVALVFFVVAGGIDEYIYHHKLPEAESDLHAKGHLALLIFVIVSLAFNWLEQHHFQMRELLDSLHIA
jgi:hypothetical protein